MPTLPTYQSKEQLQQVQQPNIGKQYGVGDVLGSIGQEMNARDEMDAKVAELAVKNQVAVAKVNASSQIALYQEEIKNNPDENPPGIQKERFSEINETASSGIDSVFGRKKFGVETGVEFVKGGIQGRTTFNTYQIEQNKQLSNNERKVWANDGLRSYGELDRINAQNLEDRLYTGDQIQSMTTKTITTAAANDAGKSVAHADVVLDRLNDPNDPYYRLTPEEKTTAVNIVQAIKKRLTEEDELQTEKNGVVGFDQGVQMIEQGGSVSDIYWGINDLYEQGVITQKEQRALNFRLNTAAGVNSKDNYDTVTSLNLSLDSIDISLEEVANKDLKSYLKQVRELNVAVNNAYGKGDISYTTLMQLTKDINTKTAKKNSLASGELSKKSPTWDQRATFGETFSNKEAYEQLLSSADDNSFEAKKMFANYIGRLQYEESDVSGEKRKEILHQVRVDKFNRDRQQSISIAASVNIPQRRDKVAPDAISEVLFQSKDGKRYSATPQQIMDSTPLTEAILISEIKKGKTREEVLKAAAKGYL